LRRILVKNKSLIFEKIISRKLLWRRMEKGNRGGGWKRGIMEEEKRGTGAVKDKVR